MSAVQQRNDEMVDILSADFIRKTDTAFLWSMLNNVFMNLPGIVGFWSCSSMSKGSKIFFGNNSAYDLATERLGIGTLNPTNPMEIVGNVLMSDPATPRYIFVIQPLTGLVNTLSYDLIASAHTPYLIDASHIKLRPNADDNKMFDVDPNGNIQGRARAGDAWTALPYTNSGGTTWADYAGGFQLGQYKKFADLVFVRGLVKRTAGVGIVVATLPVGYRPTFQSQLFSSYCSGGACRIDVNTAGEIIDVGGVGSAWMTVNLIFSTL